MSHVASIDFSFWKTCESDNSESTARSVYTEKLSATVSYVCPFRKKKAVTVCCQGLSGSFVEINDTSNHIWMVGGGRRGVRGGCFFLFACFPSHFLHRCLFRLVPSYSNPTNCCTCAMPLFVVLPLFRTLESSYSEASED